ncbi:MAG: hypothetical protein IRY83_06440 [Chloroflexi bacterium]|nr:hypothetical protein [Chloroflexota bacterium]
MRQRWAVNEHPNVLEVARYLGVSQPPSTSKLIHEGKLAHLHELHAAHPRRDR